MDPERWFHELMVRHRVVLRHGTGKADGAPETCAILSPVREAWIDYPLRGFAGRRRRLAVSHGGHRITFVGRTRPLPPLGPRATVRTARDLRGREVPLAALDPDTRTIHVLLRFPLYANRVSTVDDPLPALLGFLIEEPLVGLLACRGPARVGDEVPAKVRGILELTLGDEAAVLRHEMTVLHRLTGLTPPAGDFVLERVRAIGSRLGILEAAPPRPRLSRAIVEREVSRLRRLVDRRTCAELRFADDRISGILNPAPEDSPLGRHAVEFRLSMARRFHDLRLDLWLIPREIRQLHNPRCLGNGSGIMARLHHERELYAVVDTVINYVASNPVAAATAGTAPAPFPLAIG